jgi:RNA polymerase sigma-70 factor (ECF subfamily)
VGNPEQTDGPVGQGADGPADEALVAAARAGDRAALETLILRYQPRVYRFGMRMCHDVEDASDIVQDTLLAMARSVGDFRGESSVSSWLFTIARRACMRKRRRSKFAPAQEESLESLGGDGEQHLNDPGPGPEQTAAGREIEAALTRALESLDPGQREVIVLRDVEGLSAPEVAEVLGISVGAVKTRLHRARLAVRQQLAPLFGPQSVAAPTPHCPDVLTLFSRHLEGEIAPEVCAEMETHLEQCGQCRGACDSLRRTLAVCRAVPAPAVPAPVAASIREAIRVCLDQQAPR